MDAHAPTINPLHCWSGHSLARGPVHVERLAAGAAKLGHRSVALTDVNGLYGATFFWRHATDAGLRPLVGAEIRDGEFRAVALIETETGYANLCRLLTHVHAGTFTPECTLGELSRGLHLIAPDAATARRLLACDLCPSGLWLGVDPATQTYPELRRLARLSQDHGLPLVATAPAMQRDEADRRTARMLAAIRTGKTLERVEPADLPHPKAMLRGPTQLARELADWPEAIRNNDRLVERCEGFALLPRGPIFPDFPCHGSTPGAELRRLCDEGLRWRYDGRAPPDADARLERELKLIESRRLSGYFLVVWDIVRYARGRGVPVAGRGSGASSLVAYLLGITNVCPLAYDIPFERFLNEKREDFPDLDIDFCWRIRDDVIDYAFDRWGRDHAAMVCTHNAFQPRSAFRETAKVCGFSDEQVSRLDESDAADPAWRRVARRSKPLVGLPRLLSVHPGGIVLGREPIDRYAPVQQAAKGVPITQYDKDACEDAGLIKLDLLGNRSLSTIRAATDLIRQRTGRAIDVERLAPDDPDTLATLRSGHTVGCNQLESPAMRYLLRAYRPADARDVMRALALIRPGAAGVGMKDTFIRRHRGLEPTPSLPPPLDAILAESHGILCYEDDVMLAAEGMTGRSRADADRFRKQVQKCRTDAEREALTGEFLGLCRTAGFDLDVARDIWHQMAKFNAYSFCRAHAGSYAILAWGIAWLKTHRPLEFWTGALNNNQSMYHPRVYVEQAKRQGIRFCRPDVNRSGELFTIDDLPPEGPGPAVRLGLGCVAGLGPAGIDAILDARRDGPFESLADFVARAPVGGEPTRALIRCGAFDNLGKTRPAAMIELNLLLATRPHVPSGQAALFRPSPTCPAPPGDYPPLRKYMEERRVLGVSVGEHIMAMWRRHSGRAACSPAGEHLPEVDSRTLADHVGKRVRIAGVLEAQRTTGTAAGGDMLFLTFDDEHGLFEATVFPPKPGGRTAPLQHYGPHRMIGQVQEQYGTVTVTAESVTLGGTAGLPSRETTRGGTPGLSSRAASNVEP